MFLFSAHPYFCSYKKWTYKRHYIVRNVGKVALFMLPIATKNVG